MGTDNDMTPGQILTAESIAPGGIILETDRAGFALVADSHGTRYAIARDGAFLPTTERGMVMDYAAAIPGAEWWDTGGGCSCLRVDRPEWSTDGVGVSLIITDGNLRAPGWWQGCADDEDGGAVRIMPVSAESWGDGDPESDAIGFVCTSVTILPDPGSPWGWPTPERVAEVVRDYGDGVADDIATGHGGATLADSLREIARNVALGEDDIA